MHIADIIALVLVVAVVVYASAPRNPPVPVQMIFEHPIGWFIALIIVIVGVCYRTPVGVALAIIFLVMTDLVMNAQMLRGLMGRRKDGFSDFNTIVEQSDSGDYSRILENRVLDNLTECNNPVHKNLSEAIDACNLCKECTGITYIDGNFELRSGPGISEAPDGKIATTWLKPADPKLTGNYIGLNLPGANEDITRNLVPNCEKRCNRDDINKEFQQKRIQFFGLPKDSPDVGILKTASEPNAIIPTTGGGKWIADETYMKAPPQLDKCSIGYSLDAENTNEWVMDAYMNPMEKCRIQILAQNPNNVFDGKPVTEQEAYGGSQSVYGPIAFREN